MDTSHLVALQQRLANEKARLENARTEQEKTYRTVVVNQVQREIDGEYQFLGMASAVDLPDLSDDDLLAALAA